MDVMKRDEQLWVLLVLFLSGSAALHQSRRSCWVSSQICAIRGSTVDLRCGRPPAVRRRPVPVEEVTWFTEMREDGPLDLRADPVYAGRVKYYCDESTCTLRIADLRESDSARYRIRIRNKRVPGAAALAVTDPDLQVKVRRSDSTWTQLFCHCSCHMPDRLSYIWYKNGQTVGGETGPLYSDYFDPADSLWCAARGHEDFPSASVCVVGRTCNRVTYADRSICASKGSSVDISSTYSHAGEAESAFWFSPQRSPQWRSPTRPEDLSEDIQYAGRVQVLEPERGRSTLRITDLRESDSAEYHFKVNTPSFDWMSSLPGTTLTVTALQVQVARVTVLRSHVEAALRCRSSCREAGLPFVWFKNGEENTREETSAHTDYFYPGDEVSCALKGHEEARSPSLYAPELPSVSVSPSAEIVEGSSVTLTCSSDANPAANYTWYKENQPPLSEEPQLVFSSIQSSDSGQFYCEAENQLGRTRSAFISVFVKYAPKLPSVSVSPSAEIVEGSSVTLTCSSDANPTANYTWYKEDEDSPKASGASRSGVGKTLTFFLFLIVLSIYLWIKRHGLPNPRRELRLRPNSISQARVRLGDISGTPGGDFFK